MSSGPSGFCRCITRGSEHRASPLSGYLSSMPELALDPVAVGEGVVEPNPGVGHQEPWSSFSNRGFPLRGAKFGSIRMNAGVNT